MRGFFAVHDPRAGLEYAARLRDLANTVKKDIVIVMRVYFEKPRTIVGWKGLINDPQLDGSFAINEGLRRARKFLLDVIELGLPAGSEFLDPISPQFYADLVAWGAIGGGSALQHQVSRYDDSGSDDEEWDSIGAGGAAAEPHPRRRRTDGGEGGGESI